MTLFFLLFLLFTSSFSLTSLDDTVIRSEVDPLGDQKLDTSKDCDENDVTSYESLTQQQTDNENQPAVHPHAIAVVFENKSGRKVNLWWDDGKDGILQSELDYPSTININTYIGHKFFFTEASNKTEIIYRVTMQKHIDSIVLYTPDEMKKRDAAFEIEKSEWMRNYYQTTGRRWKNFYPRAPVEHYKYEITEIGEEFKAISYAYKRRLCREDEISQIPQDIIMNYETKYDEWDREFEEKLANGDYTSDEELPEGSIEGYGTSAIPPFYEYENYIFYNRTWFCSETNTNNLIPNSPQGTDTTSESDPQGQEADEYTLEVLCTRPELLLVRNFLSHDECDHIISLGQHIGLKRSTVSEKALVTLDRTSQTLWLDRDLSPMLDNIVRRIGNVIQIPHEKLFLNASSESLQLVHYYTGELYKSHFDYGTEQANNRYITFLIYLNDVPKGGETSFPDASKECKEQKDGAFITEQGNFGYNPGKGSVMFFYNLYKDGNVDSKTLHYAEPPLEGEKWMSNLWIWDPVFAGSS